MSAKSHRRNNPRTNRTPGWDYADVGVYFITIVTRGRQHFFGSYKGGKVHLNAAGKIAHNYWNQIPSHFPHVSLDEFVVMPNHIHGIICLDTRILVDRKPGTELVNATTLTNPGAKNEYFQRISPLAASLPTIIRSYKAAVSKDACMHEAEFGWQNRYHDIIIKNRDAFINIKNYIIKNPSKWKEDEWYSNTV